MKPIQFDTILDDIVKHDPRYHREAYLFVREALDYTQKQICKQTKGEPRHVTGQELLEGIRSYALDQFGPMTRMLLNEWGVTQCADFGEIVFNMVDHGLLNKTDRDRRSDFKDGYDFGDAFSKPFLPAKKQIPPPHPAPQKSSTRRVT